MASRAIQHKPDPFCPPIHDYDQGADPFNLHELKYAVVQGYHFHSCIPIEERGLKHSYYLIELPIYGDRGSYADFPMTINVFDFDLSFARQRVNLFDAHNILALYNHSYFMRMHIHYAWLLRHMNVDILLPELFFETQDHIFLFCGIFKLGVFVRTLKLIISIL